MTIDKDKAKNAALEQAKKNLDDIKILIKRLKTDLNNEDEGIQFYSCITIKALAVFLTSSEGLQHWTRYIQEDIEKDTKRIITPNLH